MKKPFLLLFFLCFGLLLNAQLDCANSMEAKVTAESGMRMRSAPSLQSKMVGSVPNSTVVKICPEKLTALTVEGIAGHWRKAEFKGKIGYIFDGFLEFEKEEVAEKNWQELISNSDSIPKENISKNTSASEFQIATEAYNYCGDVSELDPGLLWYGFYPKPDRVGATDYQIRKVDLEVILSAERLSEKLEFDIQTNEEEHSIFLLGLNRPLNTKSLEIKDNEEALRFSGRKVFPGQELVLKGGSNSIKLTATGSVENADPCPILKNYVLLLKNGTETQNLSKELNLPAQCGMPEVFWFGDFTGDGIPELILVTVQESKNEFILFLSQQTKDGDLLKKQTQFTIKKCY